MYDDEEYYYRKRHRRKLYRSPNGLIFGVCEGLSDYTGISVGLIRFLAIVTFIISGFAPIGIIYLLMAIFIPSRY
ncbi:MAG: PspC domain-containing protein [Spirochaetia bacterium]|nr:PspC domain-containing protein [Spirochaetia bacterium]